MTTSRKSKKPDRRGEAVYPTYVFKLIEQEGPAEAARLLGVSPTLLYNAKNDQLVTKVVEVAAKGILSASEEVAPERVVAPPAAAQSRNAVVVVELPADQVNAIRKLVAKLGWEIIN